jgi:60 kDa SS-A/Ro ribonucleoprotein
MSSSRGCGLSGTMLLPLNFLAAQTAAPGLTREIEAAMLRCYASQPKLPGWTVFILDVSGSMSCPLSSRSAFTRRQVGGALMMLAAELAERVTFYLTASTTGRLAPYRGFAVLDAIEREWNRYGGGGIYTQQCLEHVRQDLKGETPDRVLVITDSQDRNLALRMPKPPGRRNYLVDVSAHANGVNYAGVWDAEISGWSENLLSFVAAVEGVETSPPLTDNEG